MATAVFSFDKGLIVTSETAGTNDFVLRLKGRHETVSLLLTSEQAAAVIESLAGQVPAAAVLKGMG